MGRREEGQAAAQGPDALQMSPGVLRWLDLIQGSTPPPTWRDPGACPPGDPASLPLPVCIVEGSHVWAPLPREEE